METYKIEIHGAKVKVSEVYDSAVVGAKIDELNSSLKTLESRVVGVDIKIDKPMSSSRITNVDSLCWAGVDGMDKLVDSLTGMSWCFHKNRSSF